MLCLDHYIEQVSGHLQDAFELCHNGRPVDAHRLDWLLEGADFAVQSLSQNGESRTPAQRARLLELLLGLANLQEYLRHHSVELRHAD